MDSQKKLTRNQSSLLRSSSTVRSSIQSLNLITEEEVIKTQRQQHRSGSTPRRIGSNWNRPTRFCSVFAIICFVFFTLFTISFPIYLRREEILTSEILLFALIVIAIILFFASKSKILINQTLIFVKQLCYDNTKKLCFYSSRTKSKPPVQWFIGEPNAKTAKEKRVIREGVEIYSNGDVYEGEFHKGKCNGSGVYSFYVNGRYEGDWVDGRYDGYGIESWIKGSKYRGQYREGLRHGYGVYRFYTGDSYAGEWCNGQSHGFGVQSCSDGSCFVGEFKFGVKHGLGVYHFRNGDRYAGEYFRDKIHGFGVYHFANGHCYEGSWHEGRKQGYGKYTFRSGDSKCGEWDGGMLKIPLPPSSDAVLRAVQSARKTGENAIHLRRVDEQVNKAVQAANKAATAARVAAVKAVQNQMDGIFCDTNV